MLKTGSIYLILMLVLAVSCKTGGKPDADIAASAYGKNLTIEEISLRLPDGISGTDSIDLAQQFIDNWIRQQVMLHEAEKHLPSTQGDFTAQLEDYKNSLLIYQYESQLIDEQLDTIVGEDEIRQFYAENQKNFQLRDNIVRVSYLHYPKSMGDVIDGGKLKRLLNSTSEKDSLELNEELRNGAIQYRLDDGNWLTFSQLQSALPFRADDPENFIRRSNVYEFSDPTQIYFLKIHEYKMAEAVSPLNFEYANIRNIIINKRRVALINKTQKEAFDKALSNNEVKIYSTTENKTQ